MAMTRRLKREAAKKAYKQFCRNFSKMKRDDTEITIVDTMTEDNDEVNVRSTVVDGNKTVRKNASTENLRRPTFKEWYAAVKRPKAFDAKPEDVVEHIEEVGGWDDE